MTIPRLLTWTQSVLALWVLTMAPLCSAADQDPAPDEGPAGLERRMDEARKQLDEAARQLADLYTQMWHMETSGSRAKRPMLGFLVGDAGQADGITVAGVTPGGGAEKAGLMAGDRIVAVNGIRLDHDGDSKPLSRLSRAMADVHAGDRVSVEYVRAGVSHKVEVVTEEKGRYMAKLMEQKKPMLETLKSLDALEDLEALKGVKEMQVLADSGRPASVLRVPAGLNLQDVSGELAGYFQVDHGVLVVHTPSRVKGLAGGDILLTVDGKPVTDAEAALATLSATKGRVKVAVKRHGTTREVDLDADALNAEQTVQVVSGDRRIRVETGVSAGDGDSDD